LANRSAGVGWGRQAGCQVRLENPHVISREQAGKRKEWVQGGGRQVAGEIGKPARHQQGAGADLRGAAVLCTAVSNPDFPSASSQQATTCAPQRMCCCPAAALLLPCCCPLELAQAAVPLLPCCRCGVGWCLPGPAAMRSTAATRTARMRSTGAAVTEASCGAVHAARR